MNTGIGQAASRLRGIFLRGLALPLVVSCGLCACGSRSGLLVASDGTGTGASAGIGGSSGTSGAGGNAGSGGSGGSGGSSGFVCPVLNWVGPALSVPLQGPEMDPLATGARSPRLVRVGGTEYAVVFEATPFPSSPSAQLAAFALHDPFGAWPPSASAPSPIATESSGFGASEGDPGLVAVAYQDGPNRVVARATPGGGTQSASVWADGFARIQFLSRSPESGYLIGFGDKALGLEWLKTPTLLPDSTGPLGCSATSLLAAAAPLASGQWLVASASDASGDCNNPKPPPKPPQNVRVDRTTGNAVLSTELVPGAFPLTALALAPKLHGAWLGYAHDDESNDAFIYRVHEVDDLGSVNPEPALLVAPTQGAPGPEDYALTSAANTFALAAVTRDTVLPGGAFQLAVFYDFAFTTLDGASFGGAYFPDSSPSLVASDDGRSLLLVFVDGNDSHPVTMTVLRADCGLVH